MIQYQPSQCSNRLGRECPLCFQLIRFRTSISVCQCLKFSHEQCLINKFLSNGITSDNKIQCKDCKCQLILQYNTDCYLKPSCNVYVIILSILFLILAIIVSLSYYFNLMHKITVFWQGFIFGILSFIFWSTLLAFLFKRQQKLVRIKTTRKQLNISGFQPQQIKKTNNHSQFSLSNQQLNEQYKDIIA